MAAKWRAIGLALGFTPRELDIIEKKYQGDPEECYPELIRRWLNRTGQQQMPTVVESLAEALRSCYVGEERLALELGERLGRGEHELTVW